MGQYEKLVEIWRILIGGVWKGIDWKTMEVTGRICRSFSVTGRTSWSFPMIGRTFRLFPVAGRACRAFLITSKRAIYWKDFQ